MKNKATIQFLSKEQILKGFRKKAQAMGFELVAAPFTQIVS